MSIWEQIRSLIAQLLELLSRAEGTTTTPPPTTTTTLPPVTTTTTAAPTEAVLQFPAGTVKTKVPQGTGQAYGFPWTQVSRWEPLYTRAGNEFGMAPLLLAAFSIPNDIKNQNIYTVVTKPVERFEIVLGRFVGYTFLMTLALLGMTVISYVLIAAAVLIATAGRRRRRVGRRLGEVRRLRARDRARGRGAGG